MAIFPLLADPARYVPCLEDLRADPAVREHWIARFERHLDTLARLPSGDRRLDETPRWAEFRAAYRAEFAALRGQPEAPNGATVLALCGLRSRLLRRHGYPDAFADLKQRENEAALRSYPEQLRRIDAADQPMALLTLNVLAANLNDFGSVEALARLEEDGGSLARGVERLPPRPWRYDDVEAAAARLLAAGERGEGVMIFVDNAGPEFVLAVVPLARALACRGATVTLAANSGPSLNDMTDREAESLLRTIAESDAVLRDALDQGSIRVVDSGGHEPLLDLSHVSVNCAAAARDTQLLMLLGMGRSIESNFDAAFTVDCIRLALAKCAHVAGLIGVPLLGPVCRLTRTAGPQATSTMLLKSPN